MKKMALLMMVAFVGLVGNNGFAQIRKIPAEVTTAFHAKYPGAKNESWGDKLTAFEASFQLDGVDTKATFSPKGEWKSSEKTMAQSQLPGVVQDGFKKSKFGEWEVKSVTFLQNKDKPDQYRIFVDRATLNKKYLYFNKDGKLIRDAATL